MKLAMRSRVRATHIEHKDLGRIVDTSTLRAGDDIPGIGYVEDGALVTFHVTDDPKKALATLRRGQLIASYGERGRHAELGPGFYVSGNPDYWMNRARRKWDFLKTMTPAEQRELTRKLRSNVEELRARRHISVDEYDHAMRDISYVDQGHYTADALVGLASQPYNISFWKPEYLRTLGIQAGQPPQILELRIRGVFAEVLRSRPDSALLRTLRRAGLSGVYTRSSMATNPELVLWNGRAVVGARQVDVRP